MKIATTIKYYKPYIPYRCRKPRYEEVEELVNANIREVSANDLQLKYSYRYCGQYDLYEYRGKLYRTAKINDICAGGFNNNYSTFIDAIKWWNLHGSCYYAKSKEYCYSLDLSTYETKEDIIKRIKKNHSKYLLVDGVLYIQEYKPLYHICTFGLGNNHGGTGWMITTSNKSAKQLNKMYRYTCYFEADEYEEAYKDALRVAENRGDTNDVDRFNKWHASGEHKIKIY